MKMLITGGTGSLGEALIKEFYNEYEITFTYHNNIVKAKELSRIYNSKGLSIEELNQSTFNYDVVINCAGINIDPKITEDYSIDCFKKVLDVNVLLPFEIIKRSLPYMKENKHGRIINVSSIYAIKPEVEMIGYNASKSALITLTKTIAKEYGDYGITANCVLPSTFESKIMDEVMNEYTHTEEEKKEYLNDLVKDNAIKRLLTAKEIAKLIRYLISDDASFITGTAIPIDGGYSI